MFRSVTLNSGDIYQGCEWELAAVLTLRIMLGVVSSAASGSVGSVGSTGSVCVVGVVTVLIIGSTSLIMSRIEIPILTSTFSKTAFKSGNLYASHSSVG